jgi:hypothetical protein
MADISVEQKSGGQKTWIFAILAVVLIIALMLWLASQSAEVGRIAAVEGDTVGATAPGGTDDPASTAETADLAAVSQAPDQYLDRTIGLQNVAVAAALGPRAFWADIPGQNPFLVVMGANVTDVQMPVSGQRLNLEGTVQEVTEEQLDAWVSSETLASGSRDEASFATHYLNATRARVAQ